MTCFHLPVSTPFPPAMFPPPGGNTCPENRQTSVSTSDVSTSFPPKTGGGNKVETVANSMIYAPCFHLFSFFYKKKRKEGQQKEYVCAREVETGPACASPSFRHAQVCA
jgi:hypothetical protein